MKTWISKALIGALLCALPFAISAQDDPQSQLQEIVDDLNDNITDSFTSAFPQRDVMSRITSYYPIDPQVASQVNAQFEQSVLGWFASAFPPTGGKDIVGKIVEFDMAGNSGHAIVRFKLPNYNYQYIRFDLGLDRRDRLVINDWVNFLFAHRMSVMVSQNLVAWNPSDAALHALVPGVEVNGSDLFMLREAVKANRENDNDRVFEIIDDMRQHIKDHPYIVSIRLKAAAATSNIDRYALAVDRRLAINPRDPLYALMVTEHFMQMQDFEKALQSMEVLLDGLGFDDGAALSRMSAMALAAGNDEDAVQYAERAIEHEPTLKLAWWSLLRAHARRDDFEGAIYALTHLEDDFGDRIDGSKLRRDRFRAFTKLADSQEFKDWRATRN